MKLAKFFLGKKKKATQPPFRWQQDWWLNIISYLEIDKIRSKGQGGWVCLTKPKCLDIEIAKGTKRDVELESESRHRKHSPSLNIHSTVS